MLLTALRAPLRLAQVQRGQWLPREVLERVQWERFRALLAHAYERSPLYRRKLEAAGVTPTDVRTRADLAALPITTRGDLRDAADVIARPYRVEDLHASMSSGSTGRTVRSYFDDEAWLIAKYLLKLRARIACGLRPRDRVAIFEAGDLERGAISAEGPLRQLLLRQRHFSVHEPLERSLEALRAYRPTALYGFPGHLQRLARSGPLDLAPTRVFTSGELLDPAGRRALEEDLGATVFDVYGCTEVKEIAWECPERSGYHVNADWLLVESCRPGAPDGVPEDGLLVTSLSNRAMPLIRYYIGDAGGLLDVPCPCGRGLPLMRPSFGRIVDHFRLRDGRVVSPYTLINQVEAVPGLAQFQIVQETPERVVVRVVPDGPLEPGLVARLRSGLEPLLPGTVVDVEPVPAIEPEPSGKLRLVTSKVGAPAPGPPRPGS